MSDQQTTRKPIVLGPGDGRRWEMGRITSVFKADSEETADRYSISEWWLEPHTKGPGAHTHDEDDVFFVIEGTLHVFVGETWHEASAGAFVLVPGGVTHDFENRSDARAGALNVSIPGGFEKHMPAIAEYWAKNPPGDA